MSKIYDKHIDKRMQELSNKKLNNNFFKTGSKIETNAKADNDQEYNDDYSDNYDDDSFV